MASSNACWGIEIGAGAIKALKLERDGDDLKAADFIVLPHKRVLSTPDIDPAEVTRLTMGALMAQYRDELKGASIAVSVPGHAAFARFAKLPPVEPKEVPKIVKFEAQQQIPFPMEEVEWDFQTFKSEESPDVEVGIFAITKERVNQQIALYEDVGLAPTVITLSPVSAYNAIAYDLSFTEQTPGTILLDIGTTSSDLIVAEAGRVWIRTFPLGGHNFTEALASTFKLTYSKAERLKRDADSSKYRKHIFQAIKPVLADLVQDVQRSISYYEDTHPDAKLERLIGIGSTFRLPGLRKLLSQQLKLDVHRLERFKRINVEGAAAADFEAVTLNMATAYGLALQGLGLQTIEANLMPTSVIRKEVWRRKTPWFVTAAALGLAAGGVTFLRPFLDATALRQAKNDPDITRPVNEARNLGNRLKSEWQQVSQQGRPGFVAANMAALAERANVYEHVHSDVASMFRVASERAARIDLSPGAELVGFTTEYLPPGTALPAPNATGAAPTGERAGDAPEEERVAGERGALAVTLVIDSRHPDQITFINDTFLEWLRRNRQRPDAPYDIVALPDADAVQWGDPSQISATGGVTRREAPSRRSAARGGDEREQPPPGTERGGAEGATQALTSLPPLPADVRSEPSEGEMYRYRIEWVLMFRERPDEGAEATAGVGGTGTEASS